MSFPGTVIDAFETGTYSVSRPDNSAPYDTNGNYTPGAPAVFTVDASVQPMSGADLQALPEHRRTDNMRKLYTETELRIGDVVTIGATTWEVYNVSTYSVIGTYYRAFVSELHA